MLNTASEDYPISVVANPLLTMELFKEFMMYDNIELSLCDIDNYGYDKEYMITLSNDEEFGLELNIDKAYYAEKDVYLSTDGFVLFHENVPCKALLDMQKNEFTKFEYDWFVLTCDEDDEIVYECECCCGCDNEECNKCCDCGENELALGDTLPSEYVAKYVINGKEVDEKTFEASMKEFNDRLDSFEKMFNQFMRLF